METIFDHNVTEEEVKLLLGLEISKERFMEWKLDKEANFSCIYRLYLIRGDKEKAKKYFDKLPDTEHKYFSLGNNCMG